jgi:uncharacterized membrane-anchored protein
MRSFVRRLSVFLGLYLAVTVGTASAQPGPLGQQPEDILKTLQYRSGHINLGDDLASLMVSGNFRYLNNPDTQTFLTQVWRNPPGSGRGALGMLLPADMDPLSADGWAVIIYYENSGYVSDEDAEKIDYDALMLDMQKETKRDSESRVSKGYESYELVGWARRPHYDAAEKKMYWAKRLRFGNDPDETLNYEIRILGRKGVLELNVVAGLDMLPVIDTRVPEILKMVSFNPGSTYAEFDPKVDEVAAYGLAGLIAGGLLTKAGFFKGLLVLLLASKKLAAGLLIGGVAAFWGGVKRFMSRK